MDKKSFRIRTTPGGEDKYLNIKLEQNFDYLEILSLKIDQENFYRDFSADYGVLVGRVIANDGLGIPNANISVFIPISDEDVDNSEIAAIYPYSDIHDKNRVGTSYNLLTPTSKMNVGTFPSKQQFLDNDTYLEVYEKYYKFTTKTNKSGDYMIFGLPVGSNSIHMDLDLSNIGEYSFRPNDLIASGVSDKLFRKTGTDSYEFLESNELETLPQIVIQNTNIDIKPLWGNVEENEIGITRYDFKISILANPTATFVVNYGLDKYVGVKSGQIIDDFSYLMIYNGRRDGVTEGGSNKYLPSRMNNLYPFVTDGDGTNLGEPYMKITKWDKNFTKGEETEDVKIIKTAVTTKLGALIAYLPCDQDKYITDEFGDNIPSLDDTKGIGTTGRYSMEVLMDDGTIPNYTAYWSYIIQNQGQDPTKKGFKFDRYRVYSASMRFASNERAKYPFALRASTDNNVVNYPNYDFESQDWVNCFLYFGKMGDGNQQTKETYVPHEVLYDLGRKYYKVETKFIDITNYIDLLADTVSTHYYEASNSDIKFASANPAPSRSNKYIFLLGLRNSLNNFKTLKSNIVR
jgi:hypothetical protein